MKKKNREQTEPIAADRIERAAITARDKWQSLMNGRARKRIGTARYDTEKLWLTEATVWPGVEVDLAVIYKGRDWTPPPKVIRRSRQPLEHNERYMYIYMTEKRYK